MTRQDDVVDVFIVGQPKSGTTALASYLAQHPDICMSVPKEPNYFATDILAESDAFHGRPAEYPVRTAQEYAKLFAHEPDATHWGEASADYLYSSAAAGNIYSHNPDATIVMSLREPISMIWSLHQEYVNEATEDEGDILQAFEKEEARKSGRLVPKGARCPSLLYYSDRIKYAEQVRRYLDLFPREQVLIVTAEELRQDSYAVCKQVFGRLDVDTGFTPDVAPVHERKAPRMKRLNQVARSPRVKGVLRQAMGQQRYTKFQKNVGERVLLKADEKRDVPDAVREQLTDRARSEVETISELLDRDLVATWGYAT